MAASLDHLTKQMEHATTFCQFAIITVQEAERALNDAGLEVTTEGMQALLKDANLGEKSELNLSDFIALMEVKSKQDEKAKQKQDSVLAKFGLLRFDRDGDGRISRDEVAEATREVYRQVRGKEMPQEQVSLEMSNALEFDEEGSVVMWKFERYLGLMG